jgi:hypothetical protein
MYLGNKQSSPSRGPLHAKLLTNQGSKYLHDDIENNINGLILALFAVETK